MPELNVVEEAEFQAFADRTGVDDRAMAKVRQLGEASEDRCRTLMGTELKPSVRNASAYISRAARGELEKAASEAADQGSTTQEANAAEAGGDVDDDPADADGDIADGGENVSVTYAVGDKLEDPMIRMPDAETAAHFVPGWSCDGTAQDDNGGYDEDQGYGNTDEWCAEEAWWAEEGPGEWPEGDDQ